ncbi:MAG TPA: ATPase domain-containing protein [Candidatus Binatia bacterium]
MASSRISTGIEGLDPLLQQGFLAAKSYVVTGDAGTGKTTACLQFLLNGLLKGEKAVYVTVDERPSDILDSAASLGWDLQKHIQDKSLVILDAAPYFSARAGAAKEREVDVQRIVTDLASHINRMEAKRLAIDPVGPLIKSDTPSGRSEEQARLLIRLLQTQLQTTNLLSSHSTGRREDEISSIEEFLASGVLALRMIRIGDRFVRTLWIKKMRGTAVEPTEYEFNIVKDKGIVLTSELPQPLEEALRPFQVMDGAALKDGPALKPAAAAAEPLRETLQPFELEKTPPDK